MRLFLSVLTGYLIFAVSAALVFQLSGRDPHQSPGPAFAIVSITAGAVFALFGGYWARKCSLRASLAGSLGVATLIATGAIISLLFERASDAMWSQLSALLIMAPAAVAGGVVSLRRQRSSKSEVAQGHASSR